MHLSVQFLVENIFSIISNYHYFIFLSCYIIYNKFTQEMKYPIFSKGYKNPQLAFFLPMESLSYCQQPEDELWRCSSVSVPVKIENDSWAEVKWID